LRQALWPGEHFGEFDRRLNKVINRTRAALGDCAERPIYLETVPRIGYRFLLPVEKLELQAENALARRKVDLRPEEFHEPPVSKRGLRAATARYLLLTAGILAGVLGGVFVASRHHRDSQLLIDPAPLTSDVGIASDPSFSPSGEELAFSWNGRTQDNFDIYVLNIRNGKLKRLTDTPEADSSPAWSRDGRHLAFLRQRGPFTADLMLIAPEGGGARSLTQIRWPPNGPSGPPEIEWMSDSQGIVVSDSVDALQSSLFVVSAESGERRKITSPPVDSKGDFFPAISQDGSTLAFTRFVNSQWNDIFLLSGLRSGKIADPIRVSRLHMQVNRLTWKSGDREIIFSGGGWMGQRFLYRISPVAGSHAIDLGNVRIEGTQPIFSSRARALVYMRKVQQSSIWQMPVSPSSGSVKGAVPNRIVASLGADLQPQLSPDGNFIAFSSNRRRNRELWFAHADGSGQKCLLSLKEDGATTPRWSPDGKWIAFESRPGGQPDVYLYEVASGLTRKLTDGQGENYAPTWSRDGQTVYVCSTRSGSYQIWKVDLASGKMTRVTRNGGRFGIESSDGKDLYYTVTADVSVLRKLSLDSGAEQDIVAKVTTFPGFDVTAKGIYYLNSNGSGADGIFYFDFASRSSQYMTSLDRPAGNGLSISRDGNRILFTQLERDFGNLMMIQNLPF
jgi:Tol biopolymer transport system component